jgi:peptide/nickel transport system substrate-binding protein
MRAYKWLGQWLLLLGLMPGMTGWVQARPLNVVGPWEITGIQPAQSGYIFSRMQVAETLIGVDEQGQLAPRLATAWRVSDDGLRWYFRLREGVRCHDGSVLGVDGVVQSLRHARAGNGVLSQAPIVAIDAAGDELEIRLSSPFAPLPAYLAHYSTLVLALAAYDSQGQVRELIGTGPYRVTGLTPPLKLDLQRTEHWWGGLPTIASASYLAVGKGETRALMAASGDADLVFSLLPVSLPALRRHPGLQIEVVTVPRTRMLKLNAASPFFSDVQVRRALSLALDRTGMARAILRNDALAATQLFPPSLAGWHDLSLAPLHHDPQEAQRLLSEAGWIPGDDGIRQRGGQRFAVTLTTFSSWPELPLLATAMQAQLRQVGIALEVAVGNSSEIVSRHRDGSLQLGLASRNFGLVPDPLGTLLQDYGPEGGDWGAMGWSDSGLQQTLDSLKHAADPALRHRVAGILQQQLPVLPLAWTELAVAASADLDGLRVDPFELSYNLSALRWAQ